MSIEVKVPMLPESVADATVVNWHKKVGDAVKRDESLVDLETDKVVLEVPAPDDGILVEINQPNGATVTANTVLALIKAGADVAATKAKPAAVTEAIANEVEASPAVRRLLSEHNLDITKINGTGKGGKVMKEDVMEFLKQSPVVQPLKNPSPTLTVTAQAAEAISVLPGQRLERRVPMSRLRAKVAERLLQAQHNAAMLTTFNEVNLQAIINLRSQYKDLFEKKHGVRLGFMSFFTKAVVEALKRFPAVNASIDDNDIVYHGYFDIGVAVSTDRGLVVPVVRDADKLTMAELELKIADYALKARNSKLALEDMQGGTFTITNGGVFGSLLATPILNPPQAGILGMHKIEERPIVEKGAVVIRPMMYIALSYDHRLIDGKESVQFLVTVKEMLEDPQRLLLEI